MEIRQSSSSQRATCIKDHNSHYLNHLINSIKHHSFPHSLSLSQSYNQLSTFPTHQYSITAKQTTHKLPISSITTIQLHHFPLKPSTSRIHLSQDTSLFMNLLHSHLYRIPHPPPFHPRLSTQIALEPPNPSPPYAQVPSIFSTHPTFILPSQNPPLHRPHLLPKKCTPQLSILYLAHLQNKTLVP